MSETVAIKEHDRLFDLYDADGCLVGKANPGKKVMLADAFYVPERTCRIVVNHGDHGPEPRFDDDVWTVHDACSECGWPMGQKNAYCPHCGARVIKEES